MLDHDTMITDTAGPVPVTVSVTQRVRPGQEQRFESWLQGIGRAAARFPGHQGLTVLPPSHGREQHYTYVFRFDDPVRLERWEDSQERRAWVSQLDGFIETPAAKQVVTGLEYWFQLPADAGSVLPSRYKMAVVTISAIFPLSLLIAEALTPHLLRLPVTVRSLLTACLLVIPMTYVVMPVMTRLFAPWLFTGRRQARPASTASVWKAPYRFEDRPAYTDPADHHR